MVSIWVALAFLVVGLVTGWTLALVWANPKLEEVVIAYRQLAARVYAQSRKRPS